MPDLVEYYSPPRNYNPRVAPMWCRLLMPFQRAPFPLCDVLRSEICSNPDDMTPRRAYADMLMEGADEDGIVIGETMHWMMDHPDAEFEYQGRGAEPGFAYRIATPLNDSSKLSLLRMSLLADKFLDKLLPPGSCVLIRKGWPEKIWIKEEFTGLQAVVGSWPIQRVEITSKHPESIANYSPNGEEYFIWRSEDAIIAGIPASYCIRRRFFQEMQSLYPNEGRTLVSAVFPVKEGAYKALEVSAARALRKEWAIGYRRG